MTVYGELLTYLIYFKMLSLFRDPNVDRQKLFGLMCVSTDECLVDRCAERILRTSWDSAKHVAAAPLDMARSAPWDYLKPQSSSSHSVFLEKLLSECTSEDSVVNSDFLCGGPERQEFVERHLPGVVNGHPWDGHPTNAISWDVFWPEGVDEPIPFVELARSHTGDDPRQNAEVAEDSTAEDYSMREYQPVTTKAGGRLWSISLAAPSTSGVDMTGLRAAYPFQLLVRIDAGREALIYDAFEYLPTPVAAFEMDSARGDPVTPSELGQIEQLLKRHYRKVSLLVGSQNDDGIRTEGPHAERCRQHGSRLHPLAEWNRFKNSRVRRVRFPVSAICGARLLIQNSSRPHESLPAARGAFSVSSLGQRSADSHEGWRALPGTMAAMGPELEPLGVLVLELSQIGMHSEAVFAEMPVWALHKDSRLRRPCSDWTPDNGFSRSRRHYIVGDASEMIELSKALATTFPHFAQLLRMSPSDDGSPVPEPARKMPAHVRECLHRMKNTLAADLPQLWPSRTPSVLSLASLAARKLAKEAGNRRVASGGGGGRKRPFGSQAQVHDFLRRAGIKKPATVNPCLKAGMLNGHIPIPAHLLTAENTKPFLKQVLLKAGCSCCGKTLKCTVRQALRQPVIGIDYGDGGEDGAVQCKDCGGNYVTGLCNGDPSFDCGKGHNHCVECPDFGVCIGDYREAHCHRCGDHFFAGNYGFPCPCRGKDSDDFGGGLSAFSESSDSDKYDEEMGDQANAGPAPSPPEGCWNGHLRGVDVATMHAQLQLQVQKFQPALDSLDGASLSSKSLADLAALFDRLRPQQQHEVRSQHSEGEEEDEDSGDDEVPDPHSDSG